MTALPAFANDRRQMLTGILCAVAASVSFSVNDMAVKFLSGDYALHQVVLIRSLIGLVFIVCVLLPFAGGIAALRTRRPGAQFARGALVVTANLLFFLGIATLPLAEAAAIFFVAPLLITALSVPILGEKVGPRRWAAVAVGMAGVLVMLRPGGDFSPVLLLPLGSALAYALMHMMTRRLKGTERAVTLTFYNQITFVIVSAGMGLMFRGGVMVEDPTLSFLLRAWVWPAPQDWPILLATGLGSALGGLLITQAYRLCEAGLAAPFEYTAMPMAVFWGLAVFGEWPDAQAWIGIALICGSGLYIGWRETRRRPLSRPAAPL